MGSSYSAPPNHASRVYPDFRKTLPSLDGKVVAITGTTTGTGFMCAQVVGELGAEVILLNRRSDRQKDSLQKLQEAVPTARFVPIECDLMNFASVRKAIAEVKEKYSSKGIDVLCNNAGIMATPDEATVDGYDTQMQTNHLSHFLLTKDLFPLLETAANARGEARVVNHSSESRKFPYGKLEARYFGKNGGNLGGNDAGWVLNGPRWVRYHQTKLANCVFTFALNDRIQAANSKVKALVCHPGLAATPLQVKAVADGGMAPLLTNMLMSNGQSAEDGAVGLIKCVAASGVNSGDFYGPTGMGLAGPANLITPESICVASDSKEMLWTESLKAVGGDDFVISPAAK